MARKLMNLDLHCYHATVEEALFKYDPKYFWKYDPAYPEEKQHDD
jgi:hypothetical protein